MPEIVNNAKDAYPLGEISPDEKRMAFDYHVANRAIAEGRLPNPSDLYATRESFTLLEMHAPISFARLVRAEIRISENRARLPPQIIERTRQIIDQGFSESLGEYWFKTPMIDKHLATLQEYFFALLRMEPWYDTLDSNAEETVCEQVVLHINAFREIVSRSHSQLKKCA